MSACCWAVRECVHAGRGNNGGNSTYKYLIYHGWCKHTFPGFQQRIPGYKPVDRHGPELVPLLTSVAPSERVLIAREDSLSK